jgi:hypothetical protein
MNSKFLEENTRPLLDKFAKQIEPYISLQQTTYSESAKDWHYSMDKMRAFAERRAYRLKEHMTAYFNCGDSALVNVSVNNNAAGYVRLNSLIINSFPWDGFYFQDVPITIEAVANPGSRFVRWSDPKYGTNPKISFKPSAVNNLVAIFDDDSESFDIVINEIMYKAAESEDTGDWIELYNPSPDSKDLSFWVLKDSSPDNVFTFPQGTVIEAESYLVITRKGKDFEKYHPDVDYIDELGFGLSEEDAVKLYNHTDELIDSVQYTAKNPWPSSSNGTGLSIELKNANLDNSLGQNWYASLIVRGTPGMKNSVDTVVPSSEKLQIEVFPNPTSSYLFIRTDYQEFEYKIVDALGSVKSVGKANYTVALSCLDLSIGSYFLEILVQGKAETIPFLIVR